TLLTLSIVWMAGRSRLAKTLELKTVDTRFRLLGDQGTATEDIVLVAIDDASIKSLEPAVGRWPWPRDTHAILLSFLERAPARLVVFDLLFTETDAQYPEGDSAFAAANCESANTIHAVHLGNQDTGAVGGDGLRRNSIPFTGGFDTFQQADLPIPEIADCATALGHVTTVLDSDGPWRRYLLLAGHDDRLLPSIALATALSALDETMQNVDIGDRQVAIDDLIVAPLDRDWRLPIWFNGGPGTYRKFSYGQLFYSELQIQENQEPGIDPEIFRDKIVIVGLTAAGLHDLFTTPYSGGREERGAGLGKMHGFEVHANVLDNLLNRRVLHQAPPWQHWGLAALMASGAVLLTLYAPLWLAVAGSIVIPSGYLAFAYYDFKLHYQLPIVSVLTSWAVALTLGFVYQYWFESAQKRKVKRLFARYVSPDVFAELMEDPAAARLGGSRREISVLFSDLRGFTSISETLEPEEIIEQLNEYFTAMVEVVFAHRGTVDKFVGDMIMAIFGAPLDDPLHADHSVQCAIAMQRRLTELNLVWSQQGRPEFHSGVGINSGDAVVGNLGSDRMQSYTVIGDSVNLGARIESLCKQFDAEILISESTFQRLHQEYPLAEKGAVTVKGKTTPVTILQVMLES
ncbi:MAG: adenylate/guanylate cyclase domain-containing protein, partial [Acidobacteriota bacterium]